MWHVVEHLDENILQVQSKENVSLLMYSMCKQLKLHIEETVLSLKLSGFGHHFYWDNVLTIVTTKIWEIEIGLHL